MLEKKIQKHFLEQINGKKEITTPSKNPIQIYKDMVHYRFIEVIENIFPIFCADISKKRLNRLVFKFIQSNPRTPYVWQMPYEFREFVLKNGLLDDMPYASNLLLFEWIEVELFMSDYKKQEVCKFSWDSKFALNGSARLYEFDYSVYKKRHKKRGKFNLIVYYDFDDHEVHFQEITEFMYIFLKKLKKDTAEIAVKRVSKKFSVPFVDVKELLQESLEFFCSKKILKDAS